MELTINIEDKQVYKTLLQFLKSLHIQVIEKKVFQKISIQNGLLLLNKTYQEHILIMNQITQ